jgi:hypothetical protein
MPTSRLRYVHAARLSGRGGMIIVLDVGVLLLLAFCLSLRWVGFA